MTNYGVDETPNIQYTHEQMITREKKVEGLDQKMSGPNQSK